MLVKNQLSFENAIAIDQSGDVTLSQSLRGILLDQAGTVTVDMQGTGTNIALPLQAGLTAAVITKVYSEGTDEGLTIVGVW